MTSPGSGNPPRWQSFARSFVDDVANLLLILIPDIEADYSQLQNIPSVRDPTAARPRVKVEWANGVDLVIRVIVDDDNSMPMLEPEAAQAYMIVQWPHLFRKKPNEETMGAGLHP